MDVSFNEILKEISNADILRTKSAVICRRKYALSNEVNEVVECAKIIWREKQNTKKYR